jgi:hypothetical protein
LPGAASRRLVMDFVVASVEGRMRRENVAWKSQLLELAQHRDA